MFRALRELNLSDLRQKAALELTREYHNLATIYLALIASGNILYFGLGFEPSNYLIYGILITLLLLVIASSFYVSNNLLTILARASLCFCLGISTAKTHYNLKPGLCLDKSYDMEIGGIIKEIKPRPQGANLLLKQVYAKHSNPDKRRNDTNLFEKPETEATNSPLYLYNIKLITSEKPERFKIGAILKAKAKLFPPAESIIPQSYDFSEYAYFNSITASGFANGEISQEASTGTSLLDRFRGLRSKIDGQLNELLPKENQGFATAILLGESAAMEKDKLEQMRTSGLSHILAVSGLHLSLAGLIFFGMAHHLLNLSDFLSAKINLRALSGVFALLGSSAYLVISGMHISAIRAYIMVVLVITALLLDKWPHSMRSLAAAAVVIIIFDPYSVCTASFQLSFSAVMGLLCFLNFKTYIYNRWPDKFRFNRLFSYFIGIILSSLVASVISAPFVAYHFNVVSLYAIIANFLAMPVVSFLLMPSALITLMLMPLKLAYLTAPLLGFSIDLIQAIAASISDLGAAKIFIPFISTKLLLLYSTGIAIFCLFASKLRYLGIIFIIIFLFKAEFNYRPKLLAINYPNTLVIGDSGKLYIYSYKPPGAFRQALWGEWLNAVEYKFYKTKDLRWRYKAILRKFNLHQSNNIKYLRQIFFSHKDNKSYSYLRHKYDHLDLSYPKTKTRFKFKKIE
jgi:ComEC/Rec2-related protein